MERLEFENKLNDFKEKGLLSIIIDDSEELERDGWGILFIPKSLYLENKDFTDNYIKDFCKVDRTKSFGMLTLRSDYHITEEYLNLIAKNGTVKRLNLNNSNCDYILTKDHFEILKKNPTLTEIITSGVEPCLEDECDERLYAVMRRKVSEYLSVGDILYSENLRMIGDISWDELENIKGYLNKRKLHGTIEFSYNHDADIIKSIIDFVNEKEEKEDEKTEFVIEISDRNKLDYTVFDDEKQNSTICVITDTDMPTDMNVYKKTEEKIREVIGDIMKHEEELTPFEKLLWLYDNVTKFRKYKKEGSEEEWEESRLLHKLMFNDKIVCVGYSYLLADLAKRIDLVVGERYVEFGKMPNDDAQYTHMENVVDLSDEEYDINGIYLIDSTQDNNDIENFYVLNHFLVTPEEYKRYIVNNCVQGFSLLECTSFQEFKELASRDKESLASLADLLSNRYPNEEIFSYSFSDYDAEISYYFSESKKLYELSKSVDIKPIGLDSIVKALVKIEKIKNSQISDEELIEKLDKICELFIQREEVAFPTNFEETKISKNLDFDYKEVITGSNKKR